MRCKSCNKPLKESEIIWRPELGEHEDLCLKCRQVVYDLTDEDAEAIDIISSSGSGDYNE